MMKKVVVSSQYLFISIPFSCQRVIESFQGKLEMVREEYRESAKVMFDINREGDIEVEIYYERPETEEEKQKELFCMLDRESRKDIS